MVRIAVLVLHVLLAIAACDDRAPRAERPPAPSPLERLDLNRATTKELEQLPAIGPELARSIIASRNARGGRFQRVEDLLAIDGIGDKRLATIRPYVFLGP